MMAHSGLSKSNDQEGIIKRGAQDYSYKRQTNHMQTRKAGGQWEHFTRDAPSEDLQLQREARLHSVTASVVVQPRGSTHYFPVYSPIQRRFDFSFAIETRFVRLATL